MRIINVGNLHKLYKIKCFTCSVCNCVFEAGNTEYTQDDDPIAGHYLKVECPYCNHDVYKYLKQ